MINFSHPSLSVGCLCWFDGDQPIRVGRHIGLDHRMKDPGIVSALMAVPLAVQFCVELFSRLGPFGWSLPTAQGFQRKAAGAQRFDSEFSLRLCGLVSLRLPCDEIDYGAV